MYTQQNGNYLCHECIGDKTLKAEIKKEGAAKRCSFCDKRRKAVRVEQIADKVDGIYREYVSLTDPYWDTGDYPENIISEMLESELEVAQAILNLLQEKYRYGVVKDGEEDYYDETSRYIIRDFGSYPDDELWKIFCHNIKHVSRFDIDNFKLLDEIFKDIASYPSSGHKQAIREITNDDPERFIYRARRADSNEKNIKNMFITPTGAWASATIKSKSEQDEFCRYLCVLWFF